MHQLKTIVIAWDCDIASECRGCGYCHPCCNLHPNSWQRVVKSLEWFCKGEPEGERWDHCPLFEFVRRDDGTKFAEYDPKRGGVLLPSVCDRD